MGNRRTLVVMFVVVALFALPAAAYAAGKGNGNGNGNREASASCSVEGNTVHAVGLPDELINFMMADAGGESGWVLGHTSAGTWSVNVPDRTGDTTYKFISRTKGKDGKQYKTFASCSAGI